MCATDSYTNVCWIRYTFILAINQGTAATSNINELQGLTFDEFWFAAIRDLGADCTNEEMLWRTQWQRGMIFSLYMDNTQCRRNELTDIRFLARATSAIHIVHIDWQWCEFVSPCRCVRGIRIRVAIQITHCWIGLAQFEVAQTRRSIVALEDYNVAFSNVTMQIWTNLYHVYAHSMAIVEGIVNISMMAADSPSLLSFWLDAVSNDSNMNQRCCCSEPFFDCALHCNNQLFCSTNQYNAMQSIVKYKLSHRI